MLEGPSRSELRNAVPAREPETGIPFGFPRRDRERQDEVVVGPFAPVQGVFRTGLTHFEAEVDEFPGQKSRARRRSRDLEGPVWRRTCADEAHVRRRGQMEWRARTSSPLATEAMFVWSTNAEEGADGR